MSILLILILIFSITGCSKNIPEGVSEEVYNDCLKILDEVDKKLQHPEYGYNGINDGILFNDNVYPIIYKFVIYNNKYTKQEKEVLEKAYEISCYIDAYCCDYIDNKPIKENGDENFKAIINDKSFIKDFKPLLSEYVKMLNLDYDKYKKKFEL